MIIHATQKKIATLTDVIPDGFIFILDTTDRSFVFKSGYNLQHEQRVISLDRIHGIDKLTKMKGFYSFEDDTAFVKVQKISENTFLGLCGDKKGSSREQWLVVENCLQEPV